MSDTVGEIVARAVNDEAFRHLLLSNPDEALRGYALTDEERALLSDVTEGNFDEFAGRLEDRTTKGWVPEP
ncbi:MAG: Os1348 family NHLP clan protein [Acidimicrobiia bacterium]|nr:Os1348 family NHLP clan protein [Acidimicrobiia bacterium]MDH4306390.1 Os1348 family NHLP clan protein [Acidimicrobiia bacterium]MDH5292136.1 Os1348 family NHLP clan protein [Acidimicrobiia bacterium]